MTTTESLDKVKRYWRSRGPATTALALAEALLSPLIRRRRRLVFDAQVDVPRQPSPWASNERLLVIGPDNFQGLDSGLLSSIQIERHRKDFDGIRKGNRLFLVTDGPVCLHRSYIRLSAGETNDRNALYFGELEMTPEIRSCETAEHARGRGLYRRVLNDQLRYLKELGYNRAVLYIMEGNTASIRGVTAAGFKLCRTLHDWILFNFVVFQRVHEHGRTAWRIFLR